MPVLWVGVANLAFRELRVMRTETPDIVGNPTLKLRKMVEPLYPEEAQRDGISGTVVVEALIDRKGVPRAVHSLRGDPILARAVSKAVKQWRWRPYRLNREAVEVDMTIAVDFEPR
jgi:TonB family protein